jgi:hypothetical protein
LELLRAKDAEAQLLDIARSEARQRRKSEEEVARLTSVVNDGYSKIASVEAMAQQLQDSMNMCTCVGPHRLDHSSHCLPSRHSCPGIGVFSPLVVAVRSQLQDRGSELAVATAVSPTAALSASQV